MVQSKKEDGRVAKIVEISDKIKLQFTDNEEVREVSESTFKRWYKKADVAHAEAASDADMTNETVTEETTPADTTQEQETPSNETPTQEETPADTNEQTPADDTTNNSENDNTQDDNATKPSNAKKGNEKKESTFKPLFDKLLEHTSQWQEVEVKKTPSYTALKAKKLFAEIHLTAKNLVVYILPVLEGLDTTGIEIKKVPEKFKWTLDTGLYIKDEVSLAKALEFIAVSYDYRINNKKVEKKQAQ
jgi:DNA mismatch repair ATPase MutL